ncbi:MAG: argininosuccinate lyase [Phycisphaeraceae bacterium]|nr:argininosuccinate lyase [Phycisphaeraceae bacterium]
MSNAKPWEHAKSTPGSESDELAARFVESLSYDTRLYQHDIRGSIAHARMLEKVGLISKSELKAIEKGLTEIEKQIDKQGQSWPGWQVELEDVHMCIEAALIEKIGEPGKKLHTGRSRNDQVATDLLLWVIDATSNICETIFDLLEACCDLAERSGNIVMPAYTHLQRAQPIVAGAEICGWMDAFALCIDRLQVIRGQDRCPLGSGAVAGSSLPLDRRHTAKALLDQNVPDEMIGAFQAALGLSDELMQSVDDATSISRNSIQSTASRDVALDFVYALAMTSMWLSRWAEQWIIYMTTEFGFISIGEAYTTGSSMMPQKRNPDMLELIRGRCGGVYGHLIALLTMCKGLPIGYNRDLQEDKRHVFAAYDTVKDCLDMAARIVRSARFNEEKIKASLDRGFLDATSLAEYLVTKGVAFRTAHQHVGKLVRLCEQKGYHQLSQLSLDDFRAVCDKAEKDVYDWLGAENVVKRYQTAGNAGVSGFEAQLQAWKERLNT